MTMSVAVPTATTVLSVIVLLVESIDLSFVVVEAEELEEERDGTHGDARRRKSVHRTHSHGLLLLLLLLLLLVGLEMVMMTTRRIMVILMEMKMKNEADEKY
jgi:hypothetical protein